MLFIYFGLVFQVHLKNILVKKAQNLLQQYKYEYNYPFEARGRGAVRPSLPFKMPFNRKFLSLQTFLLRMPL